MAMRYLTALLLAAAVSALSTGPAQADLGDQLAKLLPNDGAANDRFGRSVAISGVTAIVGTPFDDDNGNASGSAYLFDTITGQLIVKLLPIDGDFDDSFGISVAISGTAAIVGAYEDVDNGVNSGSAYIFDISDPKNPVEIAKLLANDGAASDWFGWSVAISGRTAIVGAPFDGDNGPESGSAYLFDTTAGRQIAKLLAEDGAAFDEFGRSVAISGATAIVGVPQTFRDANGSAYLFDTTTGRQIAKLLANDGAKGDVFGSSVAIIGDVAIVGAPHYEDGNDSNSGSAYLFDISDPSNPVQIDKLRADDGAEGDNFGFSVAISGATAIVGAWLDGDNGKWSGSAYIFDISDPKNPVQIAKLLPDDGAAGDEFGRSVAISGATAIVGASADDDNGPESGSAYLFDAAATPAIPGDIDGDGIVGLSDLLILLAEWGPCGDCEDCPADLDRDCTVGLSDLLILLANWG